MSDKHRSGQHTVARQKEVKSWIRIRIENLKPVRIHNTGMLIM